MEHLAQKVNLAFDSDPAGNKLQNNLRGVEVRVLKSPKKDFGDILDDPYLRKMYLEGEDR